MSNRLNVLVRYLFYLLIYLTDQEFTEPPQCMPDQYKVPGCSITAYWNYYEGEKYLVANKNEMLITRNEL